jgi:tetratricopeptide (TPR) repeat protein
LGLSEESAVEEILNQAERLEKEYEWLGAAEAYAKALKLLPQDDFSRRGETYEGLGYAFYRAAFQAENNDEFRQRLRQATVDYDKAKESYQKLNDPAKTGRALRCNAMNAFIGYWLATEAHEKKKLIDECRILASEVLKALEKTGGRLEYGKTFNQFSKSIDFSFCLEWDGQTRERILRDAAGFGELAIKSLSPLQDNTEIARAYAKTADYLYALGYIFLNRDEREKIVEKARGYWQKAKELSEEGAMLELPSILYGLSLEFSEGTDEAVKVYEKALEYSKKTKDGFIIGRALDMLTYHMGWSGYRVYDLEEWAKLREKTMQYATEARHQYSNVSFISPGYGFLWVESDAEYYVVESSSETDLDKRQELLRKAAEAGPALLERAEKSGYPDAVWYAHHVMGNILASSASLEANSQVKNKLLEDALQHKKEALGVIERIGPSMYWERGISQSGIGYIKAQLADLTLDSDAKRKMLLEAIISVEDGVRLLAEGIVSIEKRGSTGSYGPLARYQGQLGLLLRRAYDLTNNRDYLEKAIEAFEEAASYAQKLDRMSLVAECYWKAAKTYDALGEHLKASESFEHASSDYKNAAEKTRQLKDLYLDHAQYMQAWSEIEKARYHHERQEYGSAKEHFEKAAELHKSLKQWNYLEHNYSAWAQVENGEELSKNDQCEEAIKIFENASKLFGETKKTLQVQLRKIEDFDEKQMATSMIKSSDLRQEYCKGRVALEEAKLLDKKGDHFASSRKYGSAAETFEKIGQTLESEQERKEFRSIISLSRAWQKMTLAEAESSPALFSEASQLFEQAKDFSPNEKTKMLVLGHSRFCRALEAGTKFADSMDPTLHATAIQQLESAAKYYMKAGFQNASEYARATKLLFDAYLYMDNAEKESDPEKKAKLYVMAEKVLQSSAGSYMKAEHPEKMEQVSKLLEKAKEERELATSLTEVLHAPPIISTTKAFTVPTPTSEEAVGSERFENAAVQANLIVRQKELKIGESLSLEIELVNAGKGPALLIKVNEVIPEGFELMEKPETCRVEDSFINMKGKRLDPLKTEELKLILKPKVQGTFALKPTILYLDENGKYKSHEPEPVIITVKELGIKGWLKGER